MQEVRQGAGAQEYRPRLPGPVLHAEVCGRANPPTRPEDAPRECTTTRDGKVVFKRKYRSHSEIPDKIKNDPSTGIYTCNVCLHYHLGHTRAGQAESLRMFRGPEDLRDLLVKRRGSASVSDVAKAAGVRPIRLRELEEGKAHPEGLETLFKVCAVLRLDLGVGIRTMR